MSKRRKICFIITSPIHYSRNFLILDELHRRKDVELHVVLGGVVISPRYVSSHFNIKDILKKKGYKNLHEVYINMEGDDHIVKAKTVGLGLIEFSSIFNAIKPDMVVVRGDRFEVLSAAIAAVNMNITLAHIEGGEVTGTIDESIRHAITKLSHYHFTTNEKSKNRVIRMGENTKRVYNFGSPDVEVVEKVRMAKGRPQVDVLKIGSGASISPNTNYLIVMYHPVTSETEQLAQHTRTLLEAVHEIAMPTFWFWPNFDAGAEKISHEIRSFKEKTKNIKIRFLRYMPPEEFLVLLNGAKCMVGNSSAGVKECSYLGIPAVNLGSRQEGRLKSVNVLDSSMKKEKIIASVKKQIKIGRYKASKIYSMINTSKKISNVLSTCKLINQKKFQD